MSRRRGRTCRSKRARPTRCGRTFRSDNTFFRLKAEATQCVSLESVASAFRRKLLFASPWNLWLPPSGGSYFLRLSGICGFRLQAEVTFCVSVESVASAFRRKLLFASQWNLWLPPSGGSYFLRVAVSSF